MSLQNVNPEVKKKKIFVACLVTGIAFYSLVHFITYCRRKLTFVPRKGPPLFFPLLPFETISFQTQDGCQLTGWYLKNKNKKKSKLLIYFHGNGGNLGDYVEAISRLHFHLNWNVLAVDYRGYGESSGEPTEEGILTDAKAVLEFAEKSLSFSLSEIVLYGFSMGSVPATYLASEYPKIGGIIVQNGFTSILELTDSYMTQFMTSVFTPLKYISKVTCNVLILHCQDDELCPFSHGERLFAEITKNPYHQKNKKFLDFAGNHNTSIFSDPKLYKAIQSLL